MAYNLDNFLKPLKETDKTVRVFDRRGISTYAINPFSVLRIFVNMSNLNVSLTGNKNIVLDFENENVSREALVKLQAYIDQLKQKVPVLVDQETEQFVESVVTKSSTKNLSGINGLTASVQRIEAHGDSIVSANINSKMDTHNISVSLTGLVPLDKGGTNNEAGFNQNELLISDGDKLISSGYSVGEGTSSNDVWTASHIINVISSITSKEVVSGEIDGNNRTFGISKIPVVGSEHVFLNGILQMEGEDNDYMMVDNNIVFSYAPRVGMKIICSYCVDYLRAEQI
jgi:hypothetical protein